MHGKQKGAYMSREYYMGRPGRSQCRHNQGEAFKVVKRVTAFWSRAGKQVYADADISVREFLSPGEAMRYLPSTKVDNVKIA